jgi:hypothetical protein
MAAANPNRCCIIYFIFNSTAGAFDAITMASKASHLLKLLFKR